MINEHVVNIYVHTFVRNNFMYDNNDCLNPNTPVRLALIQIENHI